MKPVDFLSPVFISVFLAAAFLASAQTGLPATWFGRVTIDTNTTTDGALIESFIGSVSVANATVGEFTSLYYLFDIVGGSGDNITFRIYGVPVSQGSNWTQAGNRTELNLSINTTASGTACPRSYTGQSGTTHIGCTGGFCVHNTCRAASTFCGDGVCDAGESSSSCSTDCGSAGGGGGGTTSGGGGGGTTVAPAPEPEKPVIAPPKPAEPAIEIKPIEEPVTIDKEAEVQEVLDAVKPEDIGLEGSIEIAGVEIKKVAEVSVDDKAATDKKVEKAAIAAATAEPAKQAVQEISSGLASGSVISVPVTRKVEVIEIRSKETQRRSKLSRVDLSFKADKPLKNVRVVEVVPKAVASSADQLVFGREKPTVLQADPILSWTFDNVAKGETKTISYIVKKELKTVEMISLAVAQEIPKAPVVEPEKPKPAPDNTILYAGAIAVVVIIAAAGYMATRKKKGLFA